MPGSRRPIPSAAHAQPEFVALCLELLAPLGPTRARRMFGGWGLYADGLFVALIADDRLFLKVDAQTEAAFVAAGCAPFVFESRGPSVTMGYREAPAETLDSPALMESWARLALQAALRARAGRAPTAPAKSATRVGRTP